MQNRLLTSFASSFSSFQLFLKFLDVLKSLEPPLSNFFEIESVENSHNYMQMTITVSPMLESQNVVGITFLRNGTNQQKRVFFEMSISPRSLVVEIKVFGM